MTWLLLFGTGIPHSKVVRDTERSRSPSLTKEIISFRRDLGWMNSGLASMWARSLSWYLLMRKKNDSSFSFSVGRLQSGHFPSISWVSVQKVSQGVQYQSSYS